MRTATQQLREVPAPEAPAELERALAPLRAQLAALEMKLEELIRKNHEQPEVSAEPNFGKLDQLRAACRDLQIPVSVDGFVLERDAAQLIGKAPHTLKNWRDQRRPIPFRKLGGRIQYDLAELAAFLAAEPPETA